MRTRPNRKAFSLLEVILALAIFGVAAVLLGELSGLGSESARHTKQMTEAQLHCESVMNEVLAGIRELKTEQEADLDVAGEGTSSLERSPWMYSINVVDGPAEGLLAVTVTVRERNENVRKQVVVSLIRLVQDPSQVTETTPLVPSSSASTSSSSSTSGSTSASGS